MPSDPNYDRLVQLLAERSRAEIVKAEEERLAKAVPQMDATDRNAMARLAYAFSSLDAEKDAGRVRESPRPGLPAVLSPPPVFTPSPVVVGSDLAQMVEKVMRMAPGLRGKTKRVQAGPTAASMYYNAQRNLPPDDFSSPLMGAFDHKRRELHLNPTLSEQERLSTLIHELTHSVGRDEKEAYEAGRLVPKVFPKGLK